jgi:hypothetical protein
MAQKTAWDDDPLTEADINTYLMGEGGAWTSYTPTLTQSSAVAKTVNWSRYARYGRTIIWSFSVTATAAGTTSNAIQLSLPVTAAASVNIIIGSGNITDSSGGAGGIYNGAWKMASTTTIGLTQTGSTSFVGVAPAFALANTDSCEGFVIYEATS